MIRIVGIDFGEKNTGISISSYDNKIAFPKAQIKTKELKQIIGSLKKEYKDIKLVFGNSIDLQGNNNIIMTLINTHKDFFEKEGYEVDFVDERFSTIEAGRIVESTDVAAATIILQSYLDRHFKI